MSQIHILTPDAPPQGDAASSRHLAAHDGRRPATALNAEPPPQYESEALLAGGEEALIIHRNETYRLRRTWTGKLILTK